MFIRLTHFNDQAAQDRGEPIKAFWISIQHIVTFTPDTLGGWPMTFLETSLAGRPDVPLYYHVNETPEQILELVDTARRPRNLNDIIAARR